MPAIVSPRNALLAEGTLIDASTKRIKTDCPTALIFEASRLRNSGRLLRDPYGMTAELWGSRKSGTCALRADSMSGRTRASHNCFPF